MYIYICGDTLTSEVNCFMFFEEKYFNTYVKKYTKNTNLLDFNNPIIPEGDTDVVFVTRVEYLDMFYEKIVSNLKQKFTLITHYGDKNSGKHIKILENPLLIKWYGCNMSTISSKTSGFPIGLESVHWRRTKFDIIRENSTNEKINLLYLNFTIRARRGDTMKKLKENGFVKNQQKNWNTYIQELSTYKFAISPPGGGVDCHRTWECLYLGVIPIVEKSNHMSYFNELPILFVDDYMCVTEDYLNKKYEEFSKTTFNTEKMDLSYWKKTFEHPTCLKRRE